MVGRGYGSSRGLPSCEDWCRLRLDAWFFQALPPSFKHGLNGQALLLSGIAVSFCRAGACEKTKQRVISRLRTDKEQLLMSCHS